MTERNRVSTIVGLTIFTAIIIGIIVYLAIAIQQNQAPTTSEAAGSALTECILNLRPDILPFYQQNGWDITQHDAIVSNWSGIDPTGYAEAAATCNGTTVATKICGEACTSNSQCKTSASGGATVCRNNRCESSACPAGQTQAGSACTCASASGSTTPTPPAVTPTSSPATCGDGICNNNETRAICPTDCPIVCGDGSCSSGESSATCSADCGAGTASLPNTAIFSDAADRLIVGAALLLVGLVILSYHKRHFAKPSSQ